MSISTTNRKFSALALAIAATSGVHQSHAEVAEEGNDSALETVVIVGRTTNTEITPEELEKQQVNDLADVFRHIPSVNVGGSLGIAQKVYIRGMEDTLLNVTVDGAPQTGTLFHHIGRVSIEPELLQKVDVQAGAGEATSGAGSIGGAIRFKTKSADDFLNGERFGGLVKANYFSNSGKKGSVALYGNITESVGMLASFTTIDRDNMEDGDGQELLGTGADQSLAFFKVNGNISKNQLFTLSYEKREETGELGQRPNWAVLESDPLYPVEGERNTVVANYTGDFSDAVKLEATAYTTESDFTQNALYGFYGGTTESTGFDVRNTSELGNHTFTYGVELRNDKVKAGPRDDAAIQYFIEMGWDPSTVIEEGQVLGVYAQNHWQVTSPLLISFGLRYDAYDLEQKHDNNKDVSSSGVSPNVGMSYAFNDAVKLVAGHARAMRGKEIGDSFTLSGSDIDSDLKAEEVENSEVGLEYSGEILAVSATVYQSTIENVIYDPLGRPVRYENIGEMETKGFEFLSAFDLGSLYLSASFSTSDSEINGYSVEGYEHNGLGSARGDTFGLEVGYSFSSGVELGWNFTYVDSLNDIEVLQSAVEAGWIEETYLLDKPSYSLHDIYLRWVPTDSLSFNLAVQNLFNEHYRDHSSVGDYSGVGEGWDIVRGIYEAGRDIRLSMSYSF